MIQTFLIRVWLRVRYHTRGLSLSGVVLRVLRDGLAKAGIKIEPYYLMQEGFRADKPLYAEKTFTEKTFTEKTFTEKTFTEYEFGFLSTEDMATIAALPDRDVANAELVRRLQAGQVCFGVKCQEEIVAFTWCDFTECAFSSYQAFPLCENEAYLFDAYTVESFRGKGIASYTRYRCYQELAKRGKTVLYSRTVSLNAPAMRFKNKLHAEVLESAVLVELFYRWRFSIRLRDYRNEPNRSQPFC